MYVSSCVHQWVKSSQSCGSYISSCVFQRESRDNIYTGGGGGGLAATSDLAAFGL